MVEAFGEEDEIQATKITADIDGEDAYMVSPDDVDEGPGERLENSQAYSCSSRIVSERERVANTADETSSEVNVFVWMTHS